MTLPWRRWRGAGRGGEKKAEGSCGSGIAVEVAVPTHFRCPISLDLMKDPVTLPTGITYDRESIERWIESGNPTCPVTKLELTDPEMIPNHAIRKMIQSWCVENPGAGIERIPTPRIPVTPYEVLEACGRIEAAAMREDARRCAESVARVKVWGKESERNRRCVRESGTGVALATAFKAFSGASVERYGGLLEEILSLLTWAFPAGKDGRSKLGTAASLSCILWFLNCDDLTARKNAVLVLKEIVSSDEGCGDLATGVEGMVEAVVRIIREPICPAATNASLVTIYNVMGRATIRTRLLELGLVHLMLDLLVDSEKSTCEKVLGVLDLVCDSEEGREMAYGHSLTMPILVKKILRVSNLATEFSVSIIWKLLRNDEDDERKGLVEAIQVGGFQKLLVLVQVGCGEGTKEKVKELLKLMNWYKGRVECVDSSLDLKYIKFKRSN